VLPLEKHCCKRCDALVSHSVDSYRFASFTSGGAMAAAGSRKAPGSRGILAPRQHNLARQWRWRADGALRSSPVVGADGMVYVACTDGEVYKLDPRGSNGGNPTHLSFARPLSVSDVLPVRYSAVVVTLLSLPLSLRRRGVGKSGRSPRLDAPRLREGHRLRYHRQRDRYS